MEKWGDGSVSRECRWSMRMGVRSPSERDTLGRR